MPDKDDFLRDVHHFKKPDDLLRELLGPGVHLQRNSDFGSAGGGAFHYNIDEDEFASLFLSALERDEAPSISVKSQSEYLRGLLPHLEEVAAHSRYVVFTSATTVLLKNLARKANRIVKSRFRQGLGPSANSIALAIFDATAQDRVTYYIVSEILRLTTNNLKTKERAQKDFTQASQQPKTEHEGKLDDQDTKLDPQVSVPVDRRTKQVNLRVDELVNTAIGESALAKRISKNAWMTEALVEKAAREGISIDVKRIESSEAADNVRPKHSQRTKNQLPDPSRPPQSEVNRYEKLIQFRAEPELLEKIDNLSLRWKINRTEVLRRLVSSFLDNLPDLPRGIDQKMSVTKSVGTRFDPDTLQQIDQAVASTGLTKSEWMRRVARWGVAAHDTHSKPGQPEP